MITLGEALSLQAWPFEMWSQKRKLHKYCTIRIRNCSVTHQASLQDHIRCKHFAMHCILDEGEKKKNQEISHSVRTFSFDFSSRLTQSVHSQKSLLSAYKQLQTLAYSKRMRSLRSLTEGKHATVIMHNYFSMWFFCFGLLFVVVFNRSPPSLWLVAKLIMIHWNLKRKEKQYLVMEQTQNTCGGILFYHPSSYLLYDKYIYVNIPLFRHYKADNEIQFQLTWIITIINLTLLAGALTFSFCSFHFTVELTI